MMQEADATVPATLSAYVETYLEEGIRREAVVRDVGAFSAFLRLAAVESGRRLNLAALSKESGVAQSTLKNFHQTLEDTFVGHRMPAYGVRAVSRSCPRALLLLRHRRAHAAAGAVFDPALLQSQGGDLLEHWVGLELVHRARYLGRGFQVTFWRTSTGAETDFVWEVDTPSHAVGCASRREIPRHLSTPGSPRAAPGWSYADARAGRTRSGGRRPAVRGRRRGGRPRDRRRHKARSTYPVDSAPRNPS